MNREAVPGTLIERLTSTPEGERLFQQERSIQEVTELICQFMESQKVSRSELAVLLGKTEDYLDEFLDGQIEMTVRMLSDVFGALNLVIHFRAGVFSIKGEKIWFIDWVIPKKSGIDRVGPMTESEADLELSRRSGSGRKFCDCDLTCGVKR